jgi:glutathione S-transferase
VLKKQFNMGEPDEAAVAAELKTADPLLDIFDKALADSGGDWICGELSIADFAFAPNFRLRNEAALPLETRRNIVAWMDRMDHRSSWRRAVSEIAG